MRQPAKPKKPTDAERKEADAKDTAKSTTYMTSKGPVTATTCQACKGLGFVKQDNLL